MESTKLFTNHRIHIVSYSACATFIPNTIVPHIKAEKIDLHLWAMYGARLMKESPKFLPVPHDGATHPLGGSLRANISPVCGPWSTWESPSWMLDAVPWMLGISLMDAGCCTVTREGMHMRFMGQEDAVSDLRI